MYMADFKSFIMQRKNMIFLKVILSGIIMMGLCCCSDDILGDKVKVEYKSVFDTKDLLIDVNPEGETRIIPTNENLDNMCEIVFVSDEVVWEKKMSTQHNDMFSFRLKYPLPHTGYNFINSEDLPTNRDKYAIENAGPLEDTFSREYKIWVNMPVEQEFEFNGMHVVYSQENSEFTIVASGNDSGRERTVYVLFMPEFYWATVTYYENNGIEIHQPPMSTSEDESGENI